MAKIIYKRVVANSYDEAMNYVRNGYAFWLIDCTKIENFKKLLESLVYGKSYLEHLKIRKKCPKYYLFREYCCQTMKYGYDETYKGFVASVGEKKYGTNNLLNVYYYLLNNLKDEYDIRQTYYYIKCGAKYGEPECTYALAKMYIKGLYYKKDVKKGISLLKKISSFHPGAQIELSKCYEVGIGVRVNKKLSKKYLEMSKQYDYVDFFKEHPEIIDVTEELIELKGEWLELDKIYKKIKNLTPCKKYEPKNLKEALEYEKMLNGKVSNNTYLVQDRYNFNKILKQIRKLKEEDILTLKVHFRVLNLVYTSEEEKKEAFEIARKLAELDDIFGISSLAYCYHNGFGTERDMSSFIKYALIGKERDDINCLFLLFKLYVKEKTRFYDEDKAYECAKRLLEIGSTKATYCFAYLYRRGIKVPEDYQVSSTIIFLGKNLKEKQAYLLDGLFLLEKANEKSTVYIEKNILNNFLTVVNYYKDPLGYDKIGLFYQKKEEFKKAFEYYIMALSSGYMPANSSIGTMYEFGTGVEKDFEKAVEYYLKDLSGSKSSTLNNLAIKYKTGTGVEKDLKKAISLYEKAVELGSKVAYSNLAHCYFEGEGVSKDYQKGFELLNQGMENESHNCYSYYGRILLNGLYGMEVDEEKAYEYLIKGIYKNNYSAYHDLASYYYRKKDYTKYGECIVKGSENPLGEYRYKLAYCYLYGYYVEKDVKKAIEILKDLLKDKIELSNSYNLLGSCYRQLKDYETAVKYYQQSVDLDDEYGQSNLADMYYDGKGVEKDREKAISLYKLAANKGHAYAKEKLEKIGSIN